MKIALIVFYLVIAIAMIAFIMVQRGPGATMGSGFGAGASGTVFGARGSANFLSSGTKWLAVVFFIISMGMAVYENRIGTARNAAEELGVMGQLPTPSETPAAPASETPAAPAAPASETPAAPAPSAETPAAPSAEVPAAPGASTTAELPAAAPAESAAPTTETTDASGDKPEEKTP
jgi:preprotein translocase subunit SecG